MHRKRVFDGSGKRIGKNQQEKHTKSKKEAKYKQGNVVRTSFQELRRQKEEKERRIEINTQNDMKAH